MNFLLAFVVMVIVGVVWCCNKANRISLETVTILGEGSTTIIVYRLVGTHLADLNN